MQVLLVHSISRPVLKVILRAAEANKRVTVYVTESRPTKSGYGPALRPAPPPRRHLKRACRMH